MFQIRFQLYRQVHLCFFDNYLKGLLRDCMVANNLCKIIYDINILNYSIYFKDKLILDVAEKFQGQASLRNLKRHLTTSWWKFKNPLQKSWSVVSSRRKTWILRKVIKTSLRLVETTCIYLMLLGKISTNARLSNI